ncbi:MAG: ATPase domain-containing protein [Promethearchaeati archaeon SRVP18_Atabeyarchaeia-1]
MSRRMSSGIEGLDALIEGGIPQGSSTLLYGPPGSWKHIFCLQFIADGLRAGEGGVMVLSNESVDEVKESWQEVGLDFDELTQEQRSSLMFVDCYSWRTTDVPYPQVIDKVVRSSMDLNHVAAAVSTATEKIGGRRIRVSVDILSSLLMNAAPQSVYQLASVMVAKLKESNSTSIFILTEGMHDVQTVASLQQLLDSVILFRNAEQQGFISKEICISKMRRTNFESKWIPVSRNGGTGRLTVGRR